MHYLLVLNGKVNEDFILLLEYLKGYIYLHLLFNSRYDFNKNKCIQTIWT